MRRIAIYFFLALAACAPLQASFANPGAATAWRVRPSGNNANGGGFDSSVTSPGTDYSQQNAPQVTVDGSTIAVANTGGASSTVSFSAGYTVSANDVGNVVHFTAGTNVTAGWYVITAATAGAPGTGTWTTDRNWASGVTSGTITAKMGGGWADFWTNTLASPPIIQGNTIYILGTAAPNPASYSYDYTVPAAFAAIGGGTTGGFVRYQSDPQTPAGAMPTVSTPGNMISTTNKKFYVQGIYFVASAATGSGVGVISPDGNTLVIRDCVLDQNGYDIGIVNTAASGFGVITNNEVWSSVAKRTTNANYAIGSAHDGNVVAFNNVHDSIGGGITLLDSYNAVMGNVVAKNGSVGINVTYANTQLDSHRQFVEGNTIDGNGSNGILLSAAGGMSMVPIFNNILSNHASAVAFAVTGGSAGANEQYRGFVQNQVYYNNAGGDLSNISYGSGDTHGGADPYVASSTENYTLK